MGPLLLVEDHDLLDRLGIAQPQAEHEAVELRLRQGERALVLDRVLGGDDQERVGHRIGRAVDRGLALLHALEQARLGLRGGPVDLVGEDDLGHDRPRPELELLGLLVVDRQAGHVRGQQVRRELDPAERAAEAARERLGQDGLAGAGHILDQEVAAAHQGDHGEAHFVVLAHDHAFDVGDDLLARFLDLRHRAPSVTGAGPLPAGWAENRPGNRFLGWTCRVILRHGRSPGSGRDGRQPDLREFRRTGTIEAMDSNGEPAGSGAPPTGRAGRRQRPLGALGPVSLEPPVGHGPRGLFGRRPALDVPDPRSGPLACLPLGRGRPARV